MKDVFAKLLVDFLATIAFLIVFAASGSIMIATAAAIAIAVGQFVHARLTSTKLAFMTWAALALAILLGSLTLLTSDPRFVLMKPSLAHFAIGAVMLKRGWMSRYMPPFVQENAPDLPVIAGYLWAALMFVLGAGTIAAAMTGDIKLWAFYVSVVLVGAKVAAFAIQYVTFRIVIGRRIAQRALT